MLKAAVWKQVGNGLKGSITHVEALAVLQAVQQDFSQASKIELVAKALRTALLAAPHGQGRFLRPILASFAILGDLEGALSIIKQVKEEQLATDGTSSRLFFLLSFSLLFSGVSFNHAVQWIIS